MVAIMPLTTIFASIIVKLMVATATVNSELIMAAMIASDTFALVVIMRVLMIMIMSDLVLYLHG